MIALIRKNLRLWGYGKSLALFAGCILFSISGRLNGGIAYERHILSAVSDHYYLTYFVLPIVLLSCFSFIDDDGEPVILRFQSYHSYFLKKWIGAGLIAVILTAVQTGAILLSGIGLPLGNEWNLAAGTTEAELFSALEQLFVSPLQAFVCFTLFQLIGSWLIFGICMWIGHFTERKWTIRIVIVLYVLSAVWIKLPAIQNIPLTSFNHLLILHHNFGEPARPWITGFTLLLFMLTIMFSVRFAWRGHLPQLRLKCHGIAAYYSYELMTKRNILILLAVVVGITLYKGLGYGAAESDAEWIYSLFAGHGTGYFQVFPFLEMLITSGVPLYLLAAFVEHTVNGQSIFISVRAKSRRHLVKGILSVSTKFLIIYAFFLLMAGLIGASLFSTGLTIVSFRLMLYAVLPVQRRDTPNQIHADQPNFPSGAAARLRAEKQIPRRVGSGNAEGDAGTGADHVGDDLHPPRGRADDLETLQTTQHRSGQENLRLSAEADEKVGGRDRRPNGAAAYRGCVLPDVVGTAMSGGGLLFRGEETSAPAAVAAKRISSNQERGHP